MTNLCKLRNSGYNILKNVIYISAVMSLLLVLLANVNSSSCSLFVIDGPSVVCLSVVCNVGAPYSGD